MQGMRKIDWLAIAFAALGGVVMGALWLDIRAAFWSIGSATAWEAPLTSTTITPIALQTNSSVRAAMAEPDVGEDCEPTGDHAATCDMPSFGTIEDSLDISDPADSQRAPAPIFDDSLPPPEEPLSTYELVDPKPEPVSVPVTLEPLDPSEPAPAVGDETSPPPTTQIDELLPRFDPLAVPHKAAKDPADEPSDMVRTLEEIIQMGSAVLRSREFYGDEESRKQYSHDLRRELSREEQRATPPSPVTPAWCAPPRPMASAPLPLPYGSTRHVDTLRDAAGQLDDIANGLERQNLYDRADQLRAAAQELRLDARKTNAGP